MCICLASDATISEGGTSSLMKEKHGNIFNLDVMSRDICHAVIIAVFLMTTVHLVTNQNVFIARKHASDLKI